MEKLYFLGAYKVHLMTVRLELGPHDPLPAEFAKTCHVEFQMPNSTVSRAQVRSISINNPAEDPPDRWVKHLAKYTYDVEMEFQDKAKVSDWEAHAPPPAPVAEEVEEVKGAGHLESGQSRDGDIDESSDSDSD